ncbi:putative 3''-deamino-3''-oxonicotianamine reductase [Medicago truncatula]|uniref:Putative 3''-deamino-3''-oxonicotianamine reductase n=1 Tax=Medicago truncatula TaxID=3880 RepID=A0A072UAG7_MEDTR|nr:hypothetical protein MTR_6g072705 [Medicago truncatula]RHN52375.1 putative 3''-deamino-3''-oxonicotianamine reductase [Medicago truncatula]
MGFSLLPSYGALMLTMTLFSKLSKPPSSKHCSVQLFLLRNLRLEYVDLYLIHWPVRLKEDVEGFNFTGEDVIPFDIKRTWKVMED